MKKILFCLLFLGNYTLWAFPNKFLNDSFFSEDSLEISNSPQLVGQLKRQGHYVMSVAINKYSIQYATGGVDNNIIIWDASDRSFVNILKGHKSPVLTLDFSPDSRFLASGSKDNSIRYWDILSAETKFKLDGHDGSISEVKFSPDGYKLASASADRTIKIWDLDEQACLVTIGGYNEAITDIAFSPDGQYIAAVSADKSLRIFGAESGEKIAVIKNAHKQYARRVTFSPNGKMIASAGDGGNIKVWNLENLQDEETLPEYTVKAHTGWIQSLEYASNGKFLVSGGHDGKIKIWDVQNDEPELSDRTFELPKNTHRNIIYDLAFSYDGKTLISAEYKNYAEVWDLAHLEVEPLKIERVLAQSRGGTSDTDEDNEDFDLAGFDPTVSGKNYLLVIGVDKYTKWNKLHNAVKDAKDVKTMLQKKYGFQASETVELYDNAVTKKNLYRTFEDLMDKISGKDNLVIYYSGHGEYNARFKQGFWVPYDADTDNRATYFSNTELLDFLGEMHAQHIFLVADACFSGALFSTRYKQTRNQAVTDHSRWGLTSGNKEEVSDGLPNQNSPFAKILLKKLNENQGDLPVSELILHVMSTVKKDNSINQEPLGEPLRLVGHESGEFVFKKK